MKRFDSSVADFTVTWYPGKLNSLTFNGKIGKRARVFLTNLCVAMSTCNVPGDNVHDQTELHSGSSMEDFSVDFEILQSRVDSMQSLINTHNDLLEGAHDLINEVTVMRLELEEEKSRNSRLEQQTKILNDLIMKCNLGSRQTSLTMNNVPTLGTNNNHQVSTISDKNCSQTKDANSLDSITHSTKPTATNVFSQQIKDYKMKHNKQRSSHNTKKQSSSQPP